MELEKLNRLIDRMQEKGCYVIVFLPPFPDRIYQELMQSDAHRDFMIKFEQTVQELCASKSVPFYDFSSMAWVDSDDEEALDGFHGSERTYGKLTLRFADDPK